jgi:AhpD family alkylhydroperoxidase
MPIKVALSFSPILACNQVERKMAKDFRELAQTVMLDGRALATAAPETLKAFGALGRAAYADRALDKKTKELIAFALSVAARCDGCLAYHGSRLAELGARRE